MQQPVLVPTVITGISNASARLTPAVGGGSWAVDASTARPRLPEDGQLSAFRVQLGLTLTTGSYTFAVVVNGVASAMSVTISSGQSGAVYAGSSIAVTAGDAVTIQCTPSGTPDALTSSQVQCAMIYTLTATTKGAILSGHAASAAALFVPPGCFTNSGTEANMQTPAPTAGTISKLYVNRRTAPGVGTSVTYTLRINGSNTALTVTISDTATDGSATVSPVAIGAGDLVSIGVTVSGAVASSTGAFGMDWTPTIAGESLLFGSAFTALADPADTYVPFGAVGQAVEANAQVPAPLAFTAKKLHTRVRVAPGGAASRTQRMRLGGSYGAQTCTITGAATTADDSTNQDSVTTGTLIDVSTTPTGTPAAATSLLFSMVAVIPTPAVGTRKLLLLGAG